MSKPREPWLYSDREGYVTDDGRIRIYGFSEVPREPLSDPVAAATEPMSLKLEPGRYSWCTCGYSKNQPFCDNAHREAPTNRKSYKFEVLEPATVEFCMCKRTGTPPFCDGSHEVLCRARESRVTGETDG